MGTLDQKSEGRGYAEIFGNKTKQSVLDFLSANTKKGYSVLDMHNTLSIPESTLSINLAELSRLGIVTFQKEGKYKYYQLMQKCVPVFRSVFHSLNQAASCTANVNEGGTAIKNVARATFRQTGRGKNE